MFFSILFQKYTLILVPYPYSTFAKWIMCSLNFCGKHILYWLYWKSLVGYEKVGRGILRHLRQWVGEGLLWFPFSHAFSQHVSSRQQPTPQRQFSYWSVLSEKLEAQCP